MKGERFKRKMKERIDKNMKLFVLGDLHYGSSNFNEDFFNHWLESFRKEKGAKKIILNGDLVDMLDSDRFYKPADVPTLNDSIDYVVDNLYPFKKDIIANLRSNHTDRAIKKFDLDVGKLIGDNLGVETSISFHEDLPLGKNSIRLFVQHNAPISKSTLLAMRRFMDSCNNIDADLYIAGHNHRSFFAPKVLRGLNYQPYRKYYAFNGCFLDYQGSYGEGKYDFLIASYPVITINRKTKQVNCEIIYSDQINTEQEE